jgi:hypothetical protein
VLQVRLVCKPPTVSAVLRGGAEALCGHRPECYGQGLTRVYQWLVALRQQLLVAAEASVAVEI